MRILGLDLSLTASGVVLAAGDELEPEQGLVVLESGTLRPGARRGIERLDWLEEQILGYNLDGFDLAAIEGYSYASPNQAHQLGELGGVVRLALYRVGVPVQVIAPGSWRKQLLGNGSMRKEQIPLEMFKRYGVEDGSIDALEAYAVALAAFRTCCGLDRPQAKKPRRRR